MSIKGFDFNGVVHKYDYNALENIPDLETDKTLTIDGAPADAKATGDRIANLQALVGSPLTASTAAGMTDNSKVYVYVGSETGYTNGNWYYYDGSAWVSGGVYNSVAVDIDTTLTLSNKAPDSKVVGDAISSLNEDITNLSVENLLLLSEIPGTSQVVTIDSNGNPVSIIYSKNGSTLRTDVFTWNAGIVTEVRTASNKYIEITTDLDTLNSSISEIQEVQ